MWGSLDAVVNAAIALKAVTEAICEFYANGGINLSFQDTHRLIASLSFSPSPSLSLLSSVELVIGKFQPVRLAGG
jgi:hypothetical protein